MWWLPLALLLAFARAVPVVNCPTNVTHGLPTAERVRVTFVLQDTDPTGAKHFQLRVYYDTKWGPGGVFPQDCLNFADAVDNRFSDCAGNVSTGSSFEFDAAAAYVIAHTPASAEAKEWWGKIDLQTNTWPQQWKTCNSPTYCPP